MEEEKIIKEVIIYGNELDVIVNNKPNEIVRFIIADAQKSEG